MAKSSGVLKRRGFGVTSRKDAWWAQPAVTFLILGAFVVYSTWAAFQNANYHWGPYLSPLYSPELFGDSPHAWFGGKPAWIPAWLPWSPALLILWAPAGFRLTCYYYRGAYYKAFWADPPACAVSEPRKGYTGEHGPPLIIQNFHRYFLYLALLFLVVLWHDVYKAMWFDQVRPDGKPWIDFPPQEFGIGVGTLVLAVNSAMLTGYTLGCHSLRHLVGGRIDRIAKRPVASACYNCVSGFNHKHMLWAWISLFAVGFADIYVRLVAMGIWTDFRLI